MLTNNLVVGIPRCMPNRRKPSFAIVFKNMIRFGRLTLRKMAICVTGVFFDTTGHTVYFVINGKYLMRSSLRDILHRRKPNYFCTFSRSHVFFISLWRTNQLIGYNTQCKSKEDGCKLTSMTKIYTRKRRFL
jgi:hypothetical protein